MNTRPPRRKPDFFRALLFAVAIGVSATVGYQYSVHYEDLASAVRIAFLGEK
jgi:hypothetical protein